MNHDRNVRVILAIDTIKLQTKEMPGYDIKIPPVLSFFCKCQMM